MARVVSFEVGARDEPEYGDPEVAEALAALGVPGYRFPLAGEPFRLVIEGVSVAVANAIRRAFYEMEGHALHFKPEDWSGTERFMTPDYVCRRLNQTPLNAEVTRMALADYVWRLEATNASEQPLDVRFGDLELVEGRADMPLFNPLDVIATVQPGKSLRIENIYVESGAALHDPAAFQQVVRPAAVPLDIPEHPRAETHTRDGGAWEQSGYKVKSAVADPRKFAITGTAQGIPPKSKATTNLVQRACETILHRLKFVRGVVGGRPGEPAAGGEAQAITDTDTKYQVVPGHSDSGEAWYEATLVVLRETETVGKLLSRTIHDLYPKVAFCVDVYTPHKDAITVSLHHPVSEPEEITEMLLAGIDAATKTIKTIRDGIAGR